MKYRVEKKFFCTEAQIEILQRRLNLLMRKDVHQTGGGYLIRSLYFDTWDHACMKENEAGVDNRKKYRIRTYDGNINFIRLEIKSKYRGYCHKEQCRLSRSLFDQFTLGMLPSLDGTETPALRHFWLDSTTRCLRPSAIIQYERAAFVSSVGNVRITFDRNICASNQVDRFLVGTNLMVPVLPTGTHLMEVKYDEFLPDTIAQVLELGNLQQTTFSKYYMGRIALGS